MSRAGQMTPERCYAGQFFGGTYGLDGQNKRHGRLAGLQIIPTSVAADTLTELQVRDVDWTNVLQAESRKKELFHVKKSVDDGEGSFITIDPPIKFDNGMEVKTNTNCRVALYVV